MTDKLNAGAKYLLDYVVDKLNKENISYNKISWKNGKEHYILSVATDFGTRFARFNSISLLEQDDLMTKTVNEFLITALIKKLRLLIK